METDEFTGPSCHVQEMKDKIFSFLKKCSDININVKAVVSDMVPQNCSLMRLSNIVATRHGEIINSCRHPCNGGKLYFACVILVYYCKNIRNAFTEGQSVLSL